MAACCPDLVSYLFIVLGKRNRSELAGDRRHVVSVFVAMMVNDATNLARLGLYLLFLCISFLVSWSRCRRGLRSLCFTNIITDKKGRPGTQVLYIVALLVVVFEQPSN